MVPSNSFEVLRLVEAHNDAR